MGSLESLSPITQLVIGISLVGILFLLLVTYLDNSGQYELKKDWREKNK